MPTRKRHLTAAKLDQQPIVKMGAILRTNNYVQALICEDAESVLPSHYLDRLCMVHFISHVLPAARAAERKHGVPATLLIAKAAYDCTFGHAPLTGEGDYFGGTFVRRVSPFTQQETLLDFMREARRISRHPKYRAAYRSAACRGELAALLCEIGIIRDPRPLSTWRASWRMYAIDIIDILVRHELWHCELMSTCDGGASVEIAAQVERTFQLDFERQHGTTHPQAARVDGSTLVARAPVLKPMVVC